MSNYRGFAMEYATHPFALLRAPHRIAFLAGLVAALMLMAGWSAELIARHTGTTLTPTVPSLFAHGFLMLYGIFPLFMCGFLFTAGPKWLDAAPPPPWAYLGVPVAMLGGLLVWTVGLSLGPLWLRCGLALYSIGFTGLIASFVRCLLSSQAAERRHAFVVAAAFLLGLAGLGAAWIWLLDNDYRAWTLMRDLALWGFLLPVFLTICHRMLPFFSANVIAGYRPWRPWTLLYAMLGGSLAHGIVSQLQIPLWPIDAVLTLLLGYTSWRWRLVASLNVKLLAMLHLAFAWLPIAFALYTLQGLLAGQGIDAFGYAPLHAITVGFFLTMLIAFVSRVSLGHSGRPLAASTLLWRLYLTTQALAALRVTTDLTPAAWHPSLYVLAAIGCLLVLAAWGRGLLSSYWRPRADGRPG
ncbi:NnrS family protein [Crenobacter sp. SG2305]|uniref:NnrS family protein n=1 Tax=Crenobacter oryzisoli TaxID=3056844 RepID=UPI0025AB0412|nr:NnrS family protein [Crenobacter sp. SG2305]MDN0082540.1 NnrS family protein [Crenobacter sp. SG2305]